MKQDSNLDFDGMAGNGVNRAKNRFAGNQHQTTNPNALINKGRGPTVGNKSDADSSYPKADRMPAFAPGKDMFMGKPQVRTPGGTRAWMPSAGQNYKGNPDKINEGRGPTKGNME
jgi:hypothetical protein